MPRKKRSRSRCSTEKDLFRWLKKNRSDWALLLAKVEWASRFEFEGCNIWDPKCYYFLCEEKKQLDDWGSCWLKWKTPVTNHIKSVIDLVLNLVGHDSMMKVGHVQLVLYKRIHFWPKKMSSQSTKKCHFGPFWERLITPIEATCFSNYPGMFDHRTMPYII